MNRNNRGIGKVIVIVMALAMLLMMAGMAVIMMKSKGAVKGEKVKEEKPTVQVPLGEFVVNLADTSEIRYLKTDIVLAVEGEMPEAEGKGEGEGGGLKPCLRDTAIEAMSSKHFNELVEADGKSQLKKDMMEAFNKKLEKDDVKVVDIYFNEFAMQ